MDVGEGEFALGTDVGKATSGQTPKRSPAGKLPD